MKLQRDEPLLGVAIAGSYLSGEMDEYSDLDLIIVVDDAHYQNILQDIALLQLTVFEKSFVFWSLSAKPNHDTMQISQISATNSIN